MRIFMIYNTKNSEYFENYVYMYIQFHHILKSEIKNYQYFIKAFYNILFFIIKNLSQK